MKKAQKTLKRFGAAGCAAALALSLFGCGQTSAPSQSPPACLLYTYPSPRDA